jgi:cytochrome P450
MPRTPDQHTASGTLPPLAEDAFDVGSTEDSLTRLSDLAGRLGGIFRIHAPSRGTDTWIINNPADIKRVLVTRHRNFTKGVGLDRVKILLGNGIMTSEGDLWRSQRRMIQPHFHRRVVEQFAQLIEQCVDERISLWHRLAATGEPVDVTEEMSQLTLDIVLKSIFGRDLSWLNERMGGNPFALVSDHSARDLQFAYKFRSLCRLVGELVEKRRAGQEEHFDLLAMLMESKDHDSGAPMSPRLLIDEAMTMVVAGHETTASALNWTWYLLAKHPTCFDALQAELDSRPEATALRFQEAESLHYTQAVLQEAMRLYPPGWILSRRTIEADTLSGYRVPPGTDIMLSPYLIQRHADYWEAPDEFRPERFMPPASDPRDAWIYIPFAAGPRHCVGENLAMYEMTVHIARVARRFRLEYVDDGPLDIEAAINLRTRRGLRMRLIARA